MVEKPSGGHSKRLQKEIEKHQTEKSLDIQIENDDEDIRVFRAVIEI